MDIFDGPTKAEAVREAVAVLESVGWCDHGLRDAEGRLCMMGAFSQACQDLNLIPDRESSGFNSLEWATLGTWFGNAVKAKTGLFAPHWNDRVATSEEQVKKLMLKIADEAELS